MRSVGRIRCEAFGRGHSHHFLFVGVEMSKLLQISDSLLFFRQFLKHPKALSSVVPSSKDLGRMALSAAQLDQAKVVVELGAGCGGMTRQIFEAIPKRTRFMAIEINEELINTARKRPPKADLILGKAQNLPIYLESRGEESCDAIISGIPWASLDPDTQSELLTVIHDSLSPGGRFVTLAFLTGIVKPESFRFRKALAVMFERTGVTPIVWKNLPPAVIIWAEKAK